MPFLAVPERIQSALEILGYTKDPPSTIQELNKRYHMLALKYHPDKLKHRNDDSHSHSQDDQEDAGVTHEVNPDNEDEVFKKINEAHKQLKDYYFESDEHLFTSSSSSSSSSSYGDYNSIFDMFIHSLLIKLSVKTGMSGENTSEFYHNGLTSIIRAFLNKGIQSAVMLFRKMDKDSCISIYEILANNQELFSISREILDELTQILEEKMRDDLIIKLNPTLIDMLTDKVYILEYESQKYYVPLWHSQLHFKRKTAINMVHQDQSQHESTTQNTELIVLCEPELPQHITIDEYNNLYIEVDVNIIELFREQILKIKLNEHIQFHLRACFVSFQNNMKQKIKLEGHPGLACVGGGSGGDMYNVTKRSNVYAIVRLIEC